MCSQHVRSVIEDFTLTGLHFWIRNLRPSSVLSLLDMIDTTKRKNNVRFNKNRAILCSTYVSNVSM